MQESDFDDKDTFHVEIWNRFLYPNWEAANRANAVIHSGPVKGYKNLIGAIALLNAAAKVLCLNDKMVVYIYVNEYSALGCFDLDLNRI